MDDTNEAFFTAAFGKEIAKSVIISAATSAALVGGMIVIGLAVKHLKIGVNKKSKKTTDNN